MSDLTPTPRTTLRRFPELGSYDRTVIDAVLDEALISHVGFVAEDGTPVVIPTIHARVGDTLLLHGSPASRMMRRLAADGDVCVTTTLLDGVVLARSVFHHSMNYRSVVLFGKAEPIEDLEERTEALRQFTERILPGRWGPARPPTEKELRATAVLSIPINEASAKVGTGPPEDDAGDLTRPVWAGVIPLALVAGEPEPDEHTPPDLPPPRLG
jgi:nitroimidazol reductase NimA-like FMN-containing flavoprotein (pyridoxamine 5'-phosphate oxidase superfamily)